MAPLRLITCNSTLRHLTQNDVMLYATAIRGNATPYNDEHNSGDDGTNHRHAFQRWFAADTEVEKAHYEENCEQANHDCAENASRGTSTRDELAQKANHGGDNDPHNKLSKGDCHVERSFIKLIIMNVVIYL